MYDNNGDWFNTRPRVHPVDPEVTSKALVIAAPRNLILYKKHDVNHSYVFYEDKKLHSNYSPLSNPLSITSNTRFSKLLGELYIWSFLGVCGILYVVALTLGDLSDNTTSHSSVSETENKDIGSSQSHVNLALPSIHDINKEYYDNRKTFIQSLLSSNTFTDQSVILSNIEPSARSNTSDTDRTFITDCSSINPGSEETSLTTLSQTSSVSTPIESTRPVLVTTSVAPSNISPVLNSADIDNLVFTPTTHSHLKDEIANNLKNIEEINNSRNDDIKQHVLGNLYDERAYLLTQEKNHMEGLLQQARKTPLNTHDTDKLQSDLNSLTQQVGSLAKQASELPTINESFSAPPKKTCTTF